LKPLFYIFTRHENQFLDISNPVAEPVVVAELVEANPPSSLAFFCGCFDASMLRQAQQSQAQRPLQQVLTTILF